MTKQELLDRLKELYACNSALKWAAKQPNIETILKECPHDWRIWALCKGLLEFVEHCNWNKLDGWSWSNLLIDQPQLAKYCNWNKLDSIDWAWLLLDQPQFTKQELLEKIKKLGACKSAQEWAALQPNMETILKECPPNWRIWALCEGLLNFTEHCNWNKLDGSDWSYLLIYQPRFAEHCDWKKLEGYDWVQLLVRQPQLAEHCDWNKLDKEDWTCLLYRQPQFAKCRVQKTKVENDQTRTT